MLRRDANCERCKLNETAEYVCLLGKGPEPCDIMIVGEAPGKREDDSGSPFVGRAGQYLDEVLEDLGLPRKKVFITNAVSCRPPDNRTPTKREINACNFWLQYQIKKVKPKFVLLLGNVALQAITGEKGIKSARGKPFEKDGILYLPTYHPSYILRGDYKDDPIFRNDVKLLKSLVKGGGLPEEKRLNIKLVHDDKSFGKMLADLFGSVSFDIETTGLYPWAKKIPHPQGKNWPKLGKGEPDPRSYDADIVSLGFGTRRTQWVWLTGKYAPTKERLEKVWKRLLKCVKIGHYAKFDLLWMKVIYKVDWHIDFDTGIAHYLLDENSRHGLKELAQRLCNAPNWDVDASTKQGKTSEAQLIKYHAHDLFYTLELYFLFKDELRADPQVRNVFKHILMPCVKVFVDAEFEGSFIDIARMGEVEKELKRRIRTAEKNLGKWVPPSRKDDFNWGSPQQVAWLLYEKLKIKCPEFTKTGAPSTSESTLKQIDHPLVKDLFDFRGARQQLSFFIEGWKPYLVKGGRLHPSFKLTGTVTGRLSCEHPNWQQVPRDEFIRTLLIAPPGWELVEADLSQIELRIAAEVSGDKAMLNAFINGQDPHWITALRELQRGQGEYKRVLVTANRLSNKEIDDYDEAIELLLARGADVCVDIDHAWKELRKKAKAVNFGFLFGMWWKKFKLYARDNYDIHLTDEQAQDSRKSFFNTWRDLEDWHKRQKRFARRNGYVRSLAGRKRRLPAAQYEGESFEKGEAERQAVNSPVQGFANDINLMALIQLSQEFPKTIYRPIATVHDSILAYVKKEHVKKVCLRTMEVMSKPALFKTLDIELRVPIEADVKIGPWGAGVSLKKYLKEAA